MPMDIDQVRTASTNAVLDKLVANLPDSKPENLLLIAEPVAEAAVAAIQHVLDNAQTSVDGESIV